LRLILSAWPIEYPQCGKGLRKKCSSRLRQEGHEFEAILSYIEILCFKKEKEKDYGMQRTYA
jgi:hypothetical protein